MVKETTNEEILEISLKIEQEGARFYHELAKHISDSKVNKFLIHMAKEEGEHEKRFKDLLSEKGDKPYGWEKDEKFRHLVDNIFQTDIFPKLKEVFSQLPEFEGFQKAIDFAIESEKISAEFYSLLGQNCINFEAKTALLLLEKEELEHLNYVQSLKDTFI
jgi:rubrerythrin